MSKTDDNRWQLLKDGIFLGISIDSNVPVGRGGSIDAEIKRIADDLNAIELLVGDRREDQE